MGGASALILPMYVHQLRETSQVAFLEKLAAFVSDLFDRVQIVDHLRVVQLGLVVLVLEDFRRRARKAGKEQRDVVLQIVQRLRGQPQRFDFYSPVLPDRKG